MPGNRKSITCSNSIPTKIPKRFNRLVAAVHVIEISKEPIELFKVLKLANIVASGGEAKMLVEEGLVRVNGEVETRKRKKIMSGDIVEVENDKLQVKIIKKS